MGAIFRIEHANIMAYLTSPTSNAPRLPLSDLREYLQVVAYNPGEYLLAEEGFEPWPEHIGTLARAALERLREGSAASEHDHAVPPAMVAQILEELRSEFSAYSLYALALGRGSDLREKAVGMAHASLYGQLLVLIPEQRDPDGLEALDPVPTFSRALHAAPDWPGFLFWTPSGVSAFCSLGEVEALFAELRDARDDPRSRRHRHFPFGPWTVAGFDDVLRTWAKRQKRYRKLLHLSDLHFGTRFALQNQALLDAQLRTVVGSVDRVVITGDLFDSPKQDYATLFANFKNNITHLAGGKEPISIPGNHDQRYLGNVGRDFEQIVSMATRKVVTDDDSEMIFVCFNSSEEGSFARGKIPTAQFRSLGAEYRTLTAARKDLERYLAVTLVHHHPFSFDVNPQSWVQRVLETIGLREESFLEMVNADELHQWCADWRIATVLHGHKHQARYITRNVTSTNGVTFPLTGIGCGTSLGAEGLPASYNLLEWDPVSRKWVASVYQSVNGGAFLETVAAVSPQIPPLVGTGG